MRLSTAPDRDEERALATLLAALAAGVRTFDTAPSYAHGEHDLHHGERLLCRALGASGVPRGEVRVVTKAGLTRRGAAWTPDGRAASLRASALRSQEALGGEPLDLLLLHCVDPRVPLATSVRALDALRKEGVARAIGVSGVGYRALVEALDLAPLSAVQVPLGAFDDAALRSGLVALAQARGLAVLAHTPLGAPDRAARLARDPVLAELAARHATSAGTLVLGWLSSLGVLPLPGVTRPETAALAARAPALAAALSPSELDAIARAVGCAPRPPPPVTPVRRDDGAEIVIVMGVQGAGKSTAVAALARAGHERLNRDEAGGTMKKLHARLEARVRAGGMRFVLDNTYPTRAARAEVIDVGRRHGLPVRCTWLDTPLAHAQVNVVDRMLARHGALLSGQELRRAGKLDPGVFLPTVQHRTLRELEPPEEDEGFAAIERVAFVRAPIPGHERRGLAVALEALADPALRASVLAQAPAVPTLAFGWTPPGAPADASLLSALAAHGVTIALCEHGGGPPSCWCRPPLPGLLVPWLRRQRIDPMRSSLVGSGRAHRPLAEALGLAFRDASDRARPP